MFKHGNQEGLVVATVPPSPSASASLSQREREPITGLHPFEIVAHPSPSIIPFSSTIVITDTRICPHVRFLLASPSLAVCEVVKLPFHPCDGCQQEPIS